jgi:TolB-like protein/tRNA A-37 threonylcarbamoyl transferase component Bud32/Tfp pilus assembly protein PilF
MADPLHRRLELAIGARYTIERELGRGGMATVYLATDLKHGRRVAIKVLDPELASAIGPERFLHEIQIAARLTHPNILPLHDSGEADGLLYYVMPYIEGESLRDRLDRERHLSVDDTMQIVRAVASALSYAHQQGVIHRDIKPANILLTGGQAIVADFGIARAIDVAGADRLTGTGLAIGTPAYMSPEQVGAERALDGRTDLYSLACVAYEMLGGEPPFTGPSVQAVMARHAVDPPPPLRTLRPAVPRGVEAAIERALAKVPQDRFTTAEEFATTLTRASTAEAIAAERGRARRTRLRWTAAVAAAALLVVAGIWRVAMLSGAPAIRRFAVLPFDNPGIDSTQAYFAEGVHEAVISDLADEGLGVIARRSVLQYQHSDKPVRVIARELGVDALIETSLSRTPDSVTVQARLVDGKNAEYLWSASFGASLAQVPSLALRVARGIGEAIAPKRGAAQGLATQGQPVDPQAYDDYLKGRSYLWRPTRTDLATARDYFERAIARDSTYAPAWAGISEYWTNARQLGYFTPQEATPPSEAAAYRALALDSTLAEPHFALAGAKVWGEWDWQGGEREFRKSLVLRPDFAQARAFYAHLLCILHRPKEAARQMAHARELDPLDPLLASINGATLTLLGRYDDAIALYRGALTRSPNNPAPLWLLWLTFDNAGQYVQADSAVLRYSRAAGDSGLAAALARGHQQGGYLGAVRAAADYEAARSRTTFIHAWDIAIWYATARDNDDAITWLERAYTEHDPTMPYLDAHPAFKRLHGDPRFQNLVRRMHLSG